MSYINVSRDCLIVTLTHRIVFILWPSRQQYTMRLKYTKRLKIPPNAQISGARYYNKNPLMLLLLVLDDGFYRNVSEGWRLTITVCGRAHRRPTCGLLLLWCQIANESFPLFHCSLVTIYVHCDVSLSITKTCLYNFDPLKPHFYIVKLGFTGIYIIFLITAQNIDCGYSLEPPQRGSSNEYPQSMFLSRNMKNIRLFYLKIFIFWW